jgi:hypothetical protein
MIHLTAISVDGGGLSGDVLRLADDMARQFRQQLEAAARGVAAARGSKLCEREDLEKARRQLLDTPHELIVRIHDLCDRTIKGGSLDGDCPAYDIRRLCAAELKRRAG